MDAAKAPKRCHFSASSNLLSRIGCAVAQKNIGNGYVNKINEHLGLSPGRIYLNEAAARDTERKRQRSYSNKKENKLDWLQDSGQVVLVGHNLKVFDFPRLLTALRAVNLETEFQHVCFGGIDSLHVMREIHPGMLCYKQEHLFKTLMNGEYSAHNAINDVLSLQKLFEKSQVPLEISCKFFATEWGFQCLAFKDMTDANVTTMDCLSRNRILSK